jgi:hypothetical protein
MSLVIPIIYLVEKFRKQYSVCNAFSLNIFTNVSLSFLIISYFNENSNYTNNLFNENGKFEVKIIYSNS